MTDAALFMSSLWEAFSGAIDVASEAARYRLALAAIRDTPALTMLTARRIAVHALEVAQ